MNRIELRRRIARSAPIGALLLLLASATLHAQRSATPAVLKIIPDCIVAHERDTVVGLAVASSARVDAPIDVRLRAVGTAAAGADHGFVETTVRIETGDSLATFTISLHDDAFAEEIESIDLLASVVTGDALFIDTTPAQIYILDDENPPVNILKDPGFEQIPTGWDYLSFVGVAITTERSRTGTRSVRMIGDTNHIRSIEQRLPAAPGDLFLFTGHVMTEGIAAFGGTIAELQWRNDRLTPFFFTTVMRHHVADAGVWIAGSGCGVAPPGTASVTLQLWIPVQPDTDGTAWFDDVALYRVRMTSDVPAENVEETRLDLSLQR